MPVQRMFVIAVNNLMKIILHWKEYGSSLSLSLSLPRFPLFVTLFPFDDVMDGCAPSDLDAQSPFVSSTNSTTFVTNNEKRT